MSYRLAIFDFDGTLADSFPWFVGVMNDVADRYRFRRFEPHEMETLRGYDSRRIMAHLRMPAWKLPFVMRDMRRRMALAAPGISLFPGVPEMLRRLDAAGIALAIVTSNSGENVERILGPDLVARIRHRGYGASLFGKRPRLRRVLREAGVVPAEAICIGDEIRDFQAAQGEGIPFGAVAWGFTRVEALRALGPAEEFATVEDVATRLTGGAEGRRPARTRTSGAG